MPSLRGLPALSGLCLLSACFNPDSSGSGTETDSDGPTGSTAATVAPTTANPSTSAESGTSENDTRSSVGDTSDADSTTAADPTTSGGDPVCGDGDVQGTEECDDGDTQSGDGCSAACLDETDFCDPGLFGALAGPDIDRLAVAGDHLYWLRPNVPSELLVVDIADPATPSNAGNLQIDVGNYPNWAPGDLLAAGDHLWTAGNNPDLMSIDISTPAMPAFDYFAGPNESGGHIEILGDALFQAYPVGEQLRARDISDPSAPTSLPSIGNPSLFFTDVAAFGTDVIAIASGHLEVWDVSTPAVPVFVGELNGAPWGQTFRSIANGDTVAIAATVGVVIVDYSLPNAPSVAATIPDELSPRDIGLRGDFAYVPVTNGLRVYDVSNPADPTSAGAYLEVEVYGSAIGFSDEHVYLGTEAGLRVLSDMPGFCDARCGNSTVEYPEECDDGNLADGDGCSAACANE